jgi:hypothetical protein
VLIGSCSALAFSYGFASQKVFNELPKFLVFLISDFDFSAILIFASLPIADLVRDRLRRHKRHREKNISPVRRITLRRTPPQACA